MRIWFTINYSLLFFNILRYNSISISKFLISCNEWIHFFNHKLAECNRKDFPSRSREKRGKEREGKFCNYATKAQQQRRKFSQCNLAHSSLEKGFCLSCIIVSLGLVNPNLGRISQCPALDICRIDRRWSVEFREVNNNGTVFLHRYVTVQLYWKIVTLPPIFHSKKEKNNVHLVTRILLEQLFE